MDDYQKFIAISRYARWIEDNNRRETWGETVHRYIDNVVAPKLSLPILEERLFNAIHDLKVMPSMRCLMTAGAALNRDNTCAFNCAYAAVDDIRIFDEAMFILLCGTGVGFSVERQFIDKLATVPETFKFVEDVIMVEDSKEGWADSYRKLLEYLLRGEIPIMNTKKVRKGGSRLKTFGGRASGPLPLIELFNFTIQIFQAAKGRKLTSIECHDIMCKIGEIVVVGGVRRSAMLSLSNLSDQRMRGAKTGAWYIDQKQRMLSNNSTCYTERPDMQSFMSEWFALVESKSGERGIFNRVAAIKQVEKNGRRKSKLPATDQPWDEADYIQFGTNPCSEIILRPNQFCNLTEVVAREDDDYESIKEKVELAAILGTIQASYTHFPYLRDIWRANTEEEALLGVSITGIKDSPCVRNLTEEDLASLTKHAVRVNAEWAGVLGINPATAVTCVKPSGTVSQLTNSASGIHGRHAPFYIRTVRADNKDPLTAFMKWNGIPNEPCVAKPDTTTIFSFPIKAPTTSVMRNQETAIEQLKFWLKFQRGWCEHKPSVTIDVKDHEWMEVGAFVYAHFDEMSGVSFLPTNDNIYQQAPYQEITEEQYNEAKEAMPESIDWELLSNFELEDNTSGSQTLACSAGACEIVDIN